MNDPELFELCKQVYEATGWKDTLAVYEQTDGIPLGEPYVAYPELERRYGLWGTQELKRQTPLYTSDYLLEKLPFPSQLGRDSFTWIGMWEQGAGATPTRQVWERAGIPLKALLKLTLALHEAGELTQ